MKTGDIKRLTPMGDTPYFIFIITIKFYQLGTERHTQKAQACTRCLHIAQGT